MLIFVLEGQTAPGQCAMRRRELTAISRVRSIADAGAATVADDGRVHADDVSARAHELTVLTRPVQAENSRHRRKRDSASNNLSLCTRHSWMLALFLASRARTHREF